MPFKLKLKKSRQYNVTSKSLFVISVHHLLVLETPTTVDCTLSSENTGQECLENVCQRLSISQLEFFGLRYIVKGTDDELRWVDLELPLSRQLEKYAAGPRLYLRVMYYVISGVSLITDEVTRNYYFLQLKSDVVEGRISCDSKQAVVLAIYCRQAQYNSHQSERHTVDYLKTLLPFPKQLIEAGLLETLTEEVLQTNAGKQNLTQSVAEGLFIAACQQLNGYGQEKFPAKDDSGMEVTLGVTVAGIVITVIDKVKFYPWHEITNVVNHKRTFNVDCADPTQNVGFILQDAKTGRYFWRLCVLQHTFYMKYEQHQAQITDQNVNLFQNIPDEINDSKENLFTDNSNSNLYSSDTYIPTSTNWQADSAASSNISLAASQQLRNINQNWSKPSDSRNSVWGLIGSSSTLNNCGQSSSCLDLSSNYTNQDRDRLKALLPGYRRAPDYETAVKQKYQSSETELRNVASNQFPSSVIMSDSHINLYSGSQPDVHRATAVADAIFGQQLQQQYPDVTQTANPIYRQYIDPKLIGLSQQLKMIQLNSPSSPYTSSRLSSASTPDLALASHRALLGYRGAYVSGSSPDLVSTRTFLKTHLMATHSNTFRYRHSQGYIPHATYENLNFLEPHMKRNLLPQKLQKVYEDAYRAQSSNNNNGHCNIKQHQQHNGSIEPIYENIPLPRQDGGSNEMRDRTSSIQSAPGIMRLKPPITASEIHNLNKSIPSLQNENITNDHRELSEMSSNSALHQRDTYIAHASPKRNQPFQTLSSTERLNQTVLSQMNACMLSSTSSANISDSSQTSSFNNVSSASYSNSTTNSFGIKEKKKRRWGFFGGSKGSLSDKYNSVTLGKNKDKSIKTLIDADDRHRWSTGLPRLSLPASISKEKLCQILKTKLLDPQLYIEFNRIPKRKDNATYNCALHEENQSRNLDPHFLPYDDNRVRITPTRDNRMGYLNASHITATVGNKQRFYIAGQSTKDLTTFFQCIWEADVYLILQLSDDVNYIPPNVNKCLEYGQFQVWQEFSQVTDRCVTSKIRLYHSPSKRYRSVWHIKCLEWADQNCPSDVAQFLEFLEEFNSVRLASVNEVPPGHNPNPPVLIHCADGVGRAGFTLAADILLHTLDHNQDLDIPRVVSQLRHQRDNILPSLAQYKFVYALLIQYLSRTRLI